MAGLVNLLTQVLTNTSTRAVQAKSLTTTSSNPFANPFVTSQGAESYSAYGANRPVRGGYFAGYYNNKPNIVGQRLFIEV